MDSYWFEYATYGNDQDGGEVEMIINIQYSIVDDQVVILSYESDNECTELSDIVTEQKNDIISDILVYG